MNACLLAEGPSDRVLLFVLRWLLTEITPTPCSLTWVDPRVLQGARALRERVERSLQHYRCDLLFVHRDADRDPPERRREEIRAACHHLHVPVVPVRCTETWLLVDEEAIRRAAGCPGGRTPLDLPRLRRLEELAHPKARLEECLRRAHEATGRRARRFRTDRAMHRLAELVTDWSVLRNLSAFRRLEADTRTALQGLGLPTG